MEVDGFKKLIFSGVIVLLLAPLFVFGQEISTTLKEKEALSILDIIRKTPLNKLQGDLYFEAIYWPSSDNAAKAGAVMLTKQSILQSELDYWFVKVPVEFSKRFIKATYKLLPLVAYGDFSGAVDLIEKYTVEQANKYINDWLKQNQAQIGSGIGAYDFWSFKNNWQVINIPYIIVFSPIDESKAKIVVEFYSQKAIEPPQNRGSFSCPEGVVDWLTSTCWPWDIWLSSSYNKKDKIEPFIMRVKGRVIKDKYGNFTWDKSAGQASVEVEFGRFVPEIDQSDVILKTLETNKSQGFLQDKINKIKRTAQGIVEQVKQFLEVFGPKTPQAQISSFTDPLNNGDEQEWSKALDEIAQQGNLIASQTEQIVNEENATSIEQMVKKMEKAVESIITGATSSEQAVATSSISSGQVRATLCNQISVQESAFDQIIFNEVAWMGTTKSTSDEWIELKNISANDIDLNGWQILNKSQGIKIIFSTTTIVKSGGFFLAERTDDNSALNIKADYIYSGALANAEEYLYLFNAKCVLQDKVKAFPCWPEGDNSTKETMERNQFFGWQTSSIIGGTPKAKNSIGKIKSAIGGGSGSVVDKNFSTSLEQDTTTQQSTSTTQDATNIEPPQILIVEIQIEDSSSTQNDFIKLFNQSTSKAVDISDWQLKKRNSNGNEDSIKKFTSGKYLIQPQEYFIWMNSAYELTTTTKPNATTTQKISSNNSVALFNKAGEIIDQVAWGSSANPFVEDLAFEKNPTKNQNLKRKFSILTSQYQDTNDNSIDFELATSDPLTDLEPATITIQAEELPGISNLMAVPSTVRGAVDLFWTCPTTAIAYVIKKSEQVITTTTWEIAETISQNIAPKTTGEIEFLQLNGLEPNKKLYFAVKYIDLLYVTSSISNNFSAIAWQGFNDNADGTITDLRAGLFWQKDALGLINNFGASSTQDNAIAFLDNQQTEWRLPNFKELASLFSYSFLNPGVEGLFEKIEPRKYWSSSRRITNYPDWGVPPVYGGWTFDFSNGKTEINSYIVGQDSDLNPFVAVKNQGILGGLADNNFDFIDNADKTITDNRTGLMWLESSFIPTVNKRKNWDLAWHFANNAVLCNDGSLLGDENLVGECSANGGVKYDDWRMPNLQEIMEITKLNNGQGIPMILPNLSGGVSFYWSSTLFDENKAWFVSDGAYYGRVDYLSKTAEDFNIQLVREK